MSKKTHWKVFQNPDYIGAYAFEPQERKVLTIAGASQQEVRGQNNRKEDCLVVSFKEPNVKPLICNVTNSKAISKVAGSSYIEDWPGTKIELFVTEVSAFGDTVEAVRVKQTAPKIHKPELTDLNKAAEALINGTSKAAIEKHYTVTAETWAKVDELVKTLKEQDNGKA